ncbi:hypothetical protein MRGA423_11985 [Mycobacterium tuberculosis RGTB423]|nr:hypothetical protein MRGA423_11985 [Mycobacterium tuberculosis RGTB423]
MHQVGADRAVGDLDTDRGSRRARGVLQVGYGVDVQLDRDEQLPLAVGYLIDDEDCRLFAGAERCSENLQRRFSPPPS